MKILLIGASGCFGTEFIKVLKHIKKNIKLKYFPSKKLNVLDFKNLQKKIESFKPNIVINSSAIVGINQCEENYEKAFAINTIGALNLAKICKKKKIILVQTSTHAVFDGEKKGFYTENDLPKPNNVYSGTKYLSEILVSSICEKYYVIRFPTLFGERQNKLLGFVDKVINSLKNDQTLKIASDKIDTLTYAYDAAIQLTNILFQKKPYGTYHLANKGKTSYLNFVKYLKSKLKSKSKIISVKDKHFISKGFKPLRTALKSTKINYSRHWKIALDEYIKNISYEK